MQVHAQTPARLSEIRSKKYDLNTFVHRDINFLKTLVKINFNEEKELTEVLYFKYKTISNNRNSDNVLAYYAETIQNRLKDILKDKFQTIEESPNALNYLTGKIYIQQIK